MTYNSFSNLIWQIADLLRGPSRPPQYERVMLPMTVLRRFDCVLAETKAKVVVAIEKHKGRKRSGDALDTTLNEVAGQRFHNHSPLEFEKLEGYPDDSREQGLKYDPANVLHHIEQRIRFEMDGTRLEFRMTTPCDSRSRPNTQRYG